MTESTLYDRLGGVFAIAAVVDRFSDAIIDSPIAGRDSANPELRQWHREQLDRLPGLKFMRILWVCAVAGGPFEYSGTHPGHDVLGLEEAHRRLHISSQEFDAVAGELARTLEEFHVPAAETEAVLGAFAAHKAEVIEGSLAPA